MRRPSWHGVLEGHAGRSARPSTSALFMVSALAMVVFGAARAIQFPSLLSFFPLVVTWFFGAFWAVVADADLRRVAAATACGVVFSALGVSWTDLSAPGPLSWELGAVLIALGLVAGSGSGVGRMRVPRRVVAKSKLAICLTRQLNLSRVCELALVALPAAMAAGYAGALGVHGYFIGLFPITVAWTWHVHLAVKDDAPLVGDGMLIIVQLAFVVLAYVGISPHLDGDSVPFWSAVMLVVLGVPAGTLPVFYADSRSRHVP